MIDSDTLLDEITAAIGLHFRTFGGGRGSSDDNPIAAALKDQPLSFAAGVDVKEVVYFVATEVASQILEKMRDLDQQELENVG